MVTIESVEDPRYMRYPILTSVMDICCRNSFSRHQFSFGLAHPAYFFVQLSHHTAIDGPLDDIELLYVREAKKKDAG